MSRGVDALATNDSSDHRSDHRRGTKDTWIYFHLITDPPPLRISIGKSSQRRRKRLGQHMSSRLGIDISIIELCEVKGKGSDETALHNHFADLRFNGAKEVFNPDDRLVDYIRWLRDQYYVAVPELDDKDWEAIEKMDSSIWMPDDTRRKPQAIGVLPGMQGPLGLADREVTGDDFYTDERITSAARRVMGGIDLDPASHAVANMKIKATRFYTFGDNGLQREWHGKVWLNPPFSAWSSWGPKLVNEIKRGHVTDACCLAPTRTLTAQYFEPLRESCQAMCVMHGRIPFWGPKAHDPDDGHCILYFGQHEAAFHREFKPLGTVFRCWKSTG